MRPSDFREFHQAIHGAPPFPWQQRLLEMVVAERKWPRVLDIPTGCGKTTCLDIALFSLALDAEEKPAKQWCPRRIAMVVDRRVVVDQVAERGRKILEALTRGNGSGILAEVSNRLKSLSRASDPLGVFTLRGGIPKDDGWARTPDQTLILASTVDQIGSRLLIQGYGVSRGMKPVHAGLLGNDLLLFLDEVHLSQAFAETLEALDGLRERFRESKGVPRRFAHVFLSATPGKTAAKPFGLTAEDKDSASPLSARLRSPKPVRLVEEPDRRSLEERCAQAAESLLDKHLVIAVVVNRVASALFVAQKLRSALDGAADVALLTGRMRPLDRDALLQELLPRLRAGRSRGDDTRKLIIVATQCIEAGADFDVDALVTESASLDALRQRFGRMDRLGQYGRSEGMIVHDKGAKVDPIYGEALVTTVGWIKSRLRKKSKAIDFGIENLELPPSDEMEGLLAPKERAPVLMPAYMDLWMQTAPPPSRVPDVALWLHGPRSGPADVQVIWRADVEEDLDNGRLGNLIERVSSIRPTSLEALPIPIGAVRRWLAGDADSSIADVEGPREDRERSQPEESRTALRWDGQNSEIVEARQVRPGDTIIVPARRGGIRDGTFDPAADFPVRDLAEQATFFARGRPMLRLNENVLTNSGLTLGTEEYETVLAGLEAAASVEPPGWKRFWLEGLAKGKVWGMAGSSGFVEGKRILPARMREILRGTPSLEHGGDLTTDEEDSFHAGRRVTLRDHSGDVERFAREYAQRLGLSSGLVEDLALAGWLHDVGKADRRFQVLLREGSMIEYLKDETPLAKSGMPPEAREAHRLAQIRSGYPKGARHEVQSLAMIIKNLEKLKGKANDIDLVLHLVASHHGWCRPFAPVAIDDVPVEVALLGHSSPTFGELNFDPISSAHDLHRLDSPIADRFWALVERYGWLELCWLETILRLADHRASEEEEARP